MNYQPTAAAEWRQSWRAVLASVVGICFCILHFYTLGVFLGPLTAAYGWSKSDITVAPTILSVFNFFAAAAVGRWASRVGVRKVVIPGFVAYCFGIFILGFAGPGLWSWYALWCLFALCYCCAGNPLWCLSVASHFNRSRGFALAVALCGTGISSAIAPLATANLIARFGWSNAYHILGIVALVIGLPLIYWLMPTTPSRSVARAPDPQGGTETLPGYTFAEALRTRCFWILAFASAVLGVGMPTLMLHFVSIGTHDHMTAHDAAAAAGFIGIAAIVGRLTTGILMDTLPGRLVASVLFAVPIAACFLLMGAHGSIAAMSMAAFVIGLCTGAEFDVLAVLVSRYMGMREFAAINGQIAAVFGLGVGFGPALGSVIYDHYGSYTPLLTGLAVAFLFPAGLVLALGNPAFPSSRR
jgi:MFS family permease